MSTFSGINTAYSALVAARAGIDVVGQNVANVNTEGYTRQRLSTSSIGPADAVGLFSGGVSAGLGVSIDGIARLGNVYLDARVRTASATAGYLQVRSEAMRTLEDSLGEPGSGGLSAQLQEFWAAWQDLSNHAGEPTAEALLLAQAGVLTDRIHGLYQAAESQWSEVRSRLGSMIGELNDAAARVADLNARIRKTVATGGSINELLDQRELLTTTIASLTGGTVRDLGDGTVEVLIGGNAIVSGDSARQLRIVGATELAGAAGAPVQVEWSNRPGHPVALDGGSIAGAIAMLAPADGTGTGGAIAEAAAAYDDFAARLADQVNTVHRNGATTGGDTGLDFFEFSAGLPPALGITVKPVDGSGIAAGAAGSGPRDGSIADALAGLGVGPDSLDDSWAAFVSKIGVAARTELQQSGLAQTASAAAGSAKLSSASVSMDEESVSLMTYQIAYQGAARVLSAIDEILDTLINRTGMVGR